MIIKHYLWGITFYGLLGFIVPSHSLLKPTVMTKTEEAEKHFYDSGYLIDVKGVPTLTNSYYEYKQVKQNVSTLKTDYKELYKQFINDREVVPYRLPYGTSGEYTVAAYSTDGQKAFERVLKNPKVSLENLKIATKLYYADRRNARPTMTNYFLKGVWEQAYEQYSNTSIVTANSSTIYGIEL